MSLRSRVAIAVGVVVLCALTIVAAVVYPAVGANLRDQTDQSLLQVARNAPTVAGKLKQAGTPRTAGPVRQHAAADPAGRGARPHRRVRQRLRA